MDTKSTNSKKYPLIVKALCVVLSALCAGVVGFAGVYGALVYQYVFKPSGYTWRITEPVPTVFRSVSLRNQMNDNLNDIDSLTRAPGEQAFLTSFEKQKDKLCEAEVQRYLSEKSAIIRNEVYYVATHYDALDTPDYYYEAYMRDFEATRTTVPTTAPTQPETTTVLPEEDVSRPEQTGADTSTPTVGVAEPETFHVDAHAPYNVMYCQKLLNTVTGLGWLQYMSVVRTEAFTEQHFRPRFTTDDAYAYLFDDDGRSIDFLSDENTVRGKISDVFDERLSVAKQNHKNYASWADASLQRNKNSFQYCLFAADGTVYSNTDKEHQNEDFFRTHKNYIICENGSIALNPDGDWTRELLPEAVETFRRMNGATLYVCLSDTIEGFSDDYAEIVSAYTKLFASFLPMQVLGFSIGALLLLAVFCVLLLVFTGHKVGADGITLSFIDRMPTDLHLLLSCGLFNAALIAAVSVAFSVPAENMDFWFLFMQLVPALTAVLWLVFLEWLTSTVRIKKAGESYFKRFVLWKLLRWLFRKVFVLLRKVKKGVLYVLEKPKKIRYVFLLTTLVYAFAAFVWIAIAAGAAEKPGLAVFGFAVLTAVFVLFYIRYLRTLDTIIDVSSDRSRMPIPGTESMPPALRTLAENLTLANEELDKAVAQAVRDARTKTELITNVSHDLKTPLTSVISYVDLLKQCDITDETAKGYLKILEEKSANLKRLIEDLIEASKVSSGNVELHCTVLDLAELATQAVVEATPELEKRGLEVKFSEAKTAPIIYADGQKTHRILENLLSNVKKYAADRSRVYIRVAETEEYGVFEVKNVSREPLDIDPQELMERFVRGDQSRTQEGNGLGLSIAQQLCAMQGGRLDIEIDGDLFKATVRLPKAEGGDVQ